MTIAIWFGAIGAIATLVLGTLVVVQAARGKLNASELWLYSLLLCTIMLTSILPLSFYAEQMATEVAALCVLEGVLCAVVVCDFFVRLVRGRTSLALYPHEFGELDFATERPKEAATEPVEAEEEPAAMGTVIQGPWGLADISDRQYLGQDMSPGELDDPQPDEPTRLDRFPSKLDEP